MSIPSYVLVHTATPVEYVEGVDRTEWIEGEPGATGGGGAPVEGAAFACVLFLPGPGGEQQNAYRPKAIRSPTLLFNPTRDVSRPDLVTDLSPIVLTKESELLVKADELAPWMGGVSPARWQLVGVAQPFGPPGTVIGVQAQLRMVED